MTRPVNGVPFQILENPHLGRDSPAQARAYGLSQNVPFDRWFYHYGLECNLSDAQISTKIQARGWAFLFFAEGLICCTHALIQHCFAKVFGCMSTDESLNMLRAQRDSLCLSATAIVFPQSAIRAARIADQNGELPIGRLLSRGRFQGIPYPIPRL